MSLASLSLQRTYINGADQNQRHGKRQVLHGKEDVVVLVRHLGGVILYLGLVSRVEQCGSAPWRGKVVDNPGDQKSASSMNLSPRSNHIEPGLDSFLIDSHSTRTSASSSNCACEMTFQIEA